jgi:segregation and condensation protein A
MLARQPSGKETPTYQVRLEAFEGPLDLLLDLIEQRELDITTISLAKITDQYLSYLHIIEEHRPDDMAEFLVVASQLLLIKSRALLPQPPKVVQEEEDVGEDLVRQLREYKRFKEIAALLRERDEAGLHMYPRSMPVSKIVSFEPKLDLEGTSVDDLVEALRALLLDRPQVEQEPSVVPFEMTIGEKIDQINHVLDKHQAVTFDQLLIDEPSRLEIIITLLALLELIRRGRAWVDQEGLFGTISITVLDDGTEREGQDSPASENV